METSKSEAASAPQQKAAHTRGGRQWYIKDPADLKIGIGVGFLFVVVVVLLQEFAGFRQDPDFAADRIVPYIEGVVQHRDQVKPFVFIDIDDQTYREWQQPLFTPRDKLATLIRTAEAGKPSAIIVDIDLSRASDSGFVVEPRSGQRKTCAEFANSDDRDLCKTITETATHIPIVLARNFNVGARDPDSRGPLRPLYSFLDPVFDTGPLFAKADSGSALWASPSREYPNVFWASPLYNLDEEWAIRHWRLWEPACVDGRLEAMPSVQLLVATLVRNASAKAGLEQLNKHLKLKGSPKCAVSRPTLEKSRFSFREDAQEQEQVLNISDTAFGQRIVYTLNNQTGLRTTVPIAAKESGDMHPAQKEEVPILRVISAKDLAPGRPSGAIAQALKSAEGDTAEETPKETSRSIDPDIFRSRIVVIGASHHESGDNHLTPKGVMPGALVNINAVHTLLDYGQLRSPHWILRILFGGAIVSIIALLFHVFYYSFAMYMSLFVISVSIVLVNYFSLQNSTLFDLSMAGLLYVFYRWFVIGFFNVFSKGWKIDNAGWRIWRWHIRKENGIGWKALLTGRYQKDHPPPAKEPAPALRP